jgi:Tol biopolymer transport system component
MGEVYLARDESLDRSIALKILPPDLVKNEERVRRFVQEAKSASSLSHPHIVTIHEIGQADVDGQPVHYIAMELVSGRTLKDLIHTDKADLRTLVRYLAQAADGLAKAHAAGLVHRDLKPENIMVTSDGFAKVLDFGLAKLVEQGAGGGETATAFGSPTGAGTILGTVGYMSPEQVQGKAVDHRSDIFSLGCVLYEAATRRRPFQADSDVETLHQILKDAPPPVDELNPEVPADFRKVIRRCLAKSPDRRWQSMKDVAIDLAEIDETYETLSVSTGSGTTTSAIGAVRDKPRSWLLPVAVVVIGIAGLSFGLWQWLGGDRSASSASLANLEITTLARITDMTGALLSVDGRLLAYTLEQPSGFSLVVRQMATSQDLVVVPPQQAPLRLLALAPDSSYAYFRSRATSDAPSWLYRVPTVGGEPRRLMEGVREMAFSPDGARIVTTFYSGTSPETTARIETLVIANADGTGPRTLVTEKDGYFFAPAWSPDGQHIVASVGGSGPLERLVAFDVADGTPQAIGSGEWETRSMAWFPDGRGFVASAATALGGQAQLWHVAWPSGSARRITADTSSYEAPIVMSQDGRTVTTALIRSDRSIWTAPADEPERATRLSGEFPSYLWPLRDGRVLARIITRGRSALWTMAADGSRRQRLTPERLDVGGVAIAALADVIVFSAGGDDGQSEGLWRMDSNGGALAEIPDSNSRSPVAVSPDGGTIYYRKYDQAAGRFGQILARPIEGGTEERANDPNFSPNGRFSVQGRQWSNTEVPLDVMAVADKRVLRTLSVPFDMGIQAWRWTWASASDALLWARVIDGVANIWRLPIDGRPPEQLTHLGPGQLDPLTQGFTYTADGAHLLLFRTERAPGEVLQFRNFR